jgi:hypothetical protein
MDARDSEVNPVRSARSACGDSGRDFRLTDVSGTVIKSILA